MRMATSLELYRYWNIVRAGRIAPRRFEIEPSDISELLSETFILEHTGGADYRYRLAGTRICEQFGQEFRGLDFLDDWQGEDHTTLFRRLRLIRERGAVLTFEFTATSPSGRSALFECVMLPLFHAQDRVDRLLGAISPVDPPEWLGEEALTSRELGSFEILWPDVVEPVSTETGCVEPTAFEQTQVFPHIRHARIVRQDRRQFRVYDGGLAGLPAKDV